MSEYKSGYQGHDSMRSKAEAAFGKEIHDSFAPESMSARGKARMRPYADGGRVRPMSQDQTDMHIPTRGATKTMGQPLMSKVQNKSIGGALGGFAKKAFNTGRSMTGLNKGGKVKHTEGKMHRVKKDAGGMARFAEGGSVAPKMNKKAFGGDVSGMPRKVNGSIGTPTPGLTSGGRTGPIKPIYKNVGLKEGGKADGGAMKRYAAGGMQRFDDGGRVKKSWGGVLGNFANKVGNQMQDGFNQAKSFGQNAAGQVSNAAQNMGNQIQGGFNSGMQSMRQAGSQMANGMQRGLNSGMQSAQNMGNQAGNQMSNGAQRGFQGFRNGLGFKKGGKVQSDGKLGASHVRMDGEHRVKRAMGGRTDVFNIPMTGQRSVAKADGGAMKKMRGGFCGVDRAPQSKAMGGMLGNAADGAAKMSRLTRKAMPFAAGGAGKVRHDEATANGSPKGTRGRRGC